MNKTDDKLIDESKKIIHNACIHKNGDIKVNTRDFSAKLLRLDALLKCENEEDIENNAWDLDDKNKKSVFSDWVADKELKILPLIVASNLYLLPVLATLSKILSLPKNENVSVTGNREIDFLFGKGVIKHSKYLEEPFRDNFRYITDNYEHDLPSIIEVNLKELNSLLNITIASLRIEGIREVIDNVHHWDIEDYCGNIRNNTINIIDEWIKGEEEGSEIEERAKDVILNENYSIMEKLLKIIINFLQNSDDKIILIVAIPARKLIWKFFKDKEKEVSAMLNKAKFSDILIASYPDLVVKNDPQIIIEKIPSYLTILSKYLNSQEIVYAIDEYLYSKMLDVVNCRLFECEKFHEEIDVELSDVDETLKDYRGKKEEHIAILEKRKQSYENGSIPIEELKKQMVIIKDKYIKKQKKELEVMNDGFLTVQNSILEQLKLIL